MQIGEPNCAQGYDIYNRRNNCPYSLLCATCDMDIEDINGKPVIATHKQREGD